MITRRYEKVQSIEDLDALLDKDQHDFLIANGLMRSSKSIHHGEQEGTYEIYNHIDDSEQILTREQLLDKEYTNIGEAMKYGTFYCEIIE